MAVKKAIHDDDLNWAVGVLVVLVTMVVQSGEIFTKRLQNLHMEKRVVGQMTFRPSLATTAVPRLESY